MKVKIPSIILKGKPRLIIKNLKTKIINNVKILSISLVGDRMKREERNNE